MDMNVNTEISKKQTKAGSTVSPEFQPNPYFRHIDRGPYELGMLLRELPRHFYPQASINAEICYQADAARKHARNSLFTLTHGLEAIGSLLIKIGCESECGLDKGVLTDLGGLISHIAVEMQFLDEVEGSMTGVMDTNAQQSAKEASNGI